MRTKQISQPAVWALFASIVFVIYARLLSAPLLWDAPLQWVPMDWTWAEFKQIWTTGYWFSAIGDSAESSEYRPVGSLLFRSLASVSSQSTWFAHALPVAFHLINCILLRSVLRQWQFSLHTQWLSIVLFALHPVNSEAIASVVGLTDLLIATSLLITAMLIHRYLRKPNLSLIIWVCSVCTLAPFVKESGLAIAILSSMVAAAAYLKGKDHMKWIFVAGLLSILTYLSSRFFLYPLDLSQSISDRQIMLNPLLTCALDDRILSSFAVLGVYMRSIILPTDLHVIYGYGSVPLVSSWSDIHFLGPMFAVVAVIVFCAFRWRRRDPVPAVLVLSAAVMYAPISHWVAQMGTNVAERLIYPIVMLVCILFAHIAKPLPRQWPLFVMLLVAPLLIWKTTERVSVWTSHESMNREIASQYESSLFAQVLIAERALNRQQIDLALHASKRALSLRPGFGPATILLAKSLTQNGDVESAIYLLNDQLSTSSDRDIWMTLLAVCCWQECTPSNQWFPEPWDIETRVATLQSIESFISGTPSIAASIKETLVEDLILIYASAGEGLSACHHLHSAEEYAWLEVEYEYVRSKKR